MENKLLKLPTPYGEMEIIWDESLYQGFVPEQHGGVLLYNGDKYFTTLSSVKDFKYLLEASGETQFDIDINLRGEEDDVRRMYDTIVKSIDDGNVTISGVPVKILETNIEVDMFRNRDKYSLILRGYL